MQSAMNPARLLTRATAGGAGFKSIPVGAFMSRTTDGGLGFFCFSTGDLHFLCFLVGTKNQLSAVEYTIRDVHVAFDAVVQHFRFTVRTHDHENRRFSMLSVGIHSDIGLLAVIENL